MEEDIVYYIARYERGDKSASRYLALSIMTLKREDAKKRPLL